MSVDAGFFAQEFDPDKNAVPDRPRKSRKIYFNLFGLRVPRSAHVNLYVDT